eukprot:14941259-Alexandrium_andersonii.AAC.1
MRKVGTGQSCPASEHEGRASSKQRADKPTAQAAAWGNTRKRGRRRGSNRGGTGHEATGARHPGTEHHKKKLSEARRPHTATALQRPHAARRKLQTTTCKP